MPARDAGTGRFTSGGSSGGMDLGSAYAKVLIDESGVDSGISSIQDKFQNLSSSLTSLGSSMTMLGAPFLAFGALAIKAFSDSQDQLAQLDSVLKSTTSHNGEFATSTAMSADDLQKLSDKLETANSKLGDMQTVYDSNTKHTVAQTLALKNQKDEVAALTAQMAAGNATTTTMINVTHLSRQALIDLSKGFQDVTKFSDETVLSAENMLLTFTNIGKDVFPDATKAVLDMSQALGQDTKSSAMQLGKALQDPIKGVTALRRVGVALTDSQKTMIEQMVAAGNVMGAQKIILKELETEFGGSAEAAGKTFSGQLEILKNHFDDLLETIGEKLMPILEGFIGWIQKAITWFQNLDPSLQNIIIGIGAFMASLALLGPIIAAIGVGIGAIGTIIGVMLGPIGLVIGAIAALFLAFQSNFLGIRDFLQPIIDSIGDFFAHFSDRIKLYGSLALMYFEYYITNPLSDFWNQKLKPAFDAFVAWFQVDGLPAIQAALNDFKVNVWDKVVSAIGTIWDAVKGAFKLFSDWFTSSGTSGGLDAIRMSINLFITQVINPFIKNLQDLWTKIQPQLEVLKLGMQAIFGWITTNVIQPVVNAIQSIIDKVTLAVNALASLGGGQVQFAPGTTFTPGAGGVGAPGGQIAIPAQTGGGGSVGIGAQGISGGSSGMHFHEGAIVIQASTKAGGQAAAAGLMDEIETRYRGRGN